MRRVVSFADFSHSDIKPDALFDRYLELSAREIRRLLLDGGRLEDVDCPACGGASRLPAFAKFGLNYVECSACATLFVSPRPSPDRLVLYARESAANEFWSAHVLKETNPARVEHLITPEVLWLANTTEEMVGAPRIFADVQSRSAEFLEGIDELKLFDTKFLVSPETAVVEALGTSLAYEVIGGGGDARMATVEADVVTCFYGLDSAHDPRDLLTSAKAMLVRGGLLFIMGSTISGFDLQVLWDRAKTLVPPENLNVFSIEGVTLLLERAGFEIVELSTPGHLDVAYLRAAVERGDVVVPRFLVYVIKRRDQNAHRALQEWLQEFRLSSHLRVVARKT